LLGYTAEKAGMVLSVAGFLLLAVIPFVGRFTTFIQSRYLIAFGWLTLAMGMYLSTKRIDLEISFNAAMWLRIAQYVPLGFIFIPATLASYIGIPKEKSNAVAGLVNFMRNIGSSVGTSVVTTIIARRSQFHQNALASNVGGQKLQAAMANLAARLHASGLSVFEAQRQASARIYGAIQGQAAALSYIDMYWLLALAAIIMFALSFVLKKNDPRTGEHVVAH
jgi:DHA2 family multidrug resistance protein